MRKVMKKQKKKRVKNTPKKLCDFLRKKKKNSKIHTVFLSRKGSKKH